MKIAKHIIVTAIISISSLFLMPACSPNKQTSVEKQAEEMSPHYPTAAKESLIQLSSSLPASADMIVCTSYGSTADALSAFKSWNIVDSAEIDRLMTDLGTHYRLNPSQLRSYFNAGFDTQSGFVLSHLEQNYFMLLSIRDAGLFRQWLDNFINEEFGRPRYHETEENGQTFVSIEVLRKDMGTLVLEPGKPALLVIGDEIVHGSGESLTAARNILSSSKLSQSDTDRLISGIGSAPIGVVSSKDSLAADLLPEKVKSVLNFGIKDFSGGIAMTQEGPAMQLRGFRAQDKEELGKLVSGLAKGSPIGRDSDILHSNPSSAIHINFDALQAETLILKYILNDELQAKYSAVKDKLTQKFLRLDASEQIIYNISSIWAVLYGINTDTEQAVPETLGYALSQNAAFYVTFKDSTLSDAFFSKVNMLKSMIPKGNINITNEDGLLQVTVNYMNRTLYAGYSQGLLALSTDSAWNQAKTALLTEPSATVDPKLLEDSNFLTVRVKTDDVKDILGARYPIIQEQIAAFLSPLNAVTLKAYATADAADIIVTADLRKAGTAQ